ncbi:MAG: hypothetical protein WA621_20525 [Candidatus Acidiferrum sp.]
MNGKSSSPISRREFARRAAIVSAVSLVPPSAKTMYPSVEKTAPQQPSGTPPLSPESQADAEARYQTILAVYGSRFSDAQKPELRRLCFAAQPSLDHVRASEIQNGDAPALFLKPLVEREKKPESAAISHASSTSAKKP